MATDTSDCGRCGRTNRDGGLFCAECRALSVAAASAEDARREAIRKASQGHYPDGSPFEDYAP